MIEVLRTPPCVIAGSIVWDVESASRVSFNGMIWAERAGRTGTTGWMALELLNLGIEGPGVEDGCKGVARGGKSFGNESPGGTDIWFSSRDFNRAPMTDVFRGKSVVEGLDGLGSSFSRSGSFRVSNVFKPLAYKHETCS